MEKYQLKCERISAAYADEEILHEVSLEIPAHQISVLLGANGCGKSTLLRVLAGFLNSQQGQVTLAGKKLQEYSPKEVARLLAVLPQQRQTPVGTRVIDLVSQGRFPYHTLFGGMSQADKQAVEEAMDMVGVTELAEKDIGDLSGGQKQRVWIALALAQQTEIIFLDEPTTFLDLSYQIEILDLLADLNQRLGKTIVMVLHDINLAARYADQIFAMKQGRIIQSGSPQEVIQVDLIKEVFDLSSVIVQDPVTNSPVVVPIGSRDAKNKRN
ncbi:iron ABC transporter ATP-binding protein [Ligilactobacillus salitolerans]|uniref:Iron ABC transporter ATP-binding protein n=1 Tax=Ligilactobacillus salitolerans TaxID=1808352 RepID=A0A401IQ06_9LACO|nr:ABC transporter ATP-binding protein [Ligilactobacillus salitolerans]GBG93619.1 iron ABC transporter ATP-binding protein [Ligilactobacillus salitolerans]